MAILHHGSGTWNGNMRVTTPDEETTRIKMRIVKDFMLSLGLYDSDDYRLRACVGPDSRSLFTAVKAFVPFKTRCRAEEDLS